MLAKCPQCDSENTDSARFCSDCGTQLGFTKDIPGATKTLETPIRRLTIGTIFSNRYEILEKLGKGGMGEVYRVRDKKLDEEMALKVLKPEIAVYKETIERFKNELKLARKITHKNVCRMYDLNEEEEIPFITMEYVQGVDLKRFIKKETKLREQEVIAIAKQVCEGLSEAHELGVIHRDLKPQNIMINEKGVAKVMDFGIARSVETSGVTQTGVIIGTPDYISPEQAEGDEVDQRSDIYSLGVILYEMVTGSVPFKGETALSVALKHKTHLPKAPRKVNPKVSEDMSRMILVCMEKEKERRYQCVEELLADLTKIEKGLPTTKREVSIETVEEGKWQNSIAVLPFANMSADPEQEYFCDGLSEELINSLTQIKGLKVIARTSAFAFKGKNEDIRDIGNKLDVSTILEGSVRKAGNRVRITAQLVNVSDGAHLWSERYDRDMEDIFAIQDEVTLTIVDKLKFELLGGVKTRLVKRYTENEEAHNFYLKGQYFWQKRTGDALKKAIEFFKMAIEKDQEYALAYTGLAQCYGIIGWYGIDFPKKVWPKAKKAIKKALELDDSLAEVHTVLSFISLYYDWNWPVFKKHIKRAMELNPGQAYAHHLNSEYYRISGRFDEAIKEIKHALELDPLSIMRHSILGDILRYAGRWDEAMEQIHKTLEMDPNFHPAHTILGYTYHQKGMYEKAIDQYKKSGELFGYAPLIIGWLGVTYANSGHRGKAENLLRELEEQSKQIYVPKTSIAGIYGALGEIDEAFQWIEKAYEERDQWLLFDFNRVPYLQDLGSDPRYTALRKKLGLP